MALLGGDIVFFQLESVDGFVFKVPRQVAKYSNALWALLYVKEGRTLPPVTQSYRIPYVNGATLKLIVEYFQFLLDQDELRKNDIDPSDIYAMAEDWKGRFLDEPKFILEYLSQAARFLDIPELIADLMDRGIYYIGQAKEKQCDVKVKGDGDGNGKGKPL